MDALAYAAASTARRGSDPSWTADEEHKLINHMSRVFEPGFDMNHIFPILSEKSLGEIKEKWKDITSAILKNASMEQRPQRPPMPSSMPPQPQAGLPLTSDIIYRTVPTPKS